MAVIGFKKNLDRKQKYQKTGIKELSSQSIRRVTENNVEINKGIMLLSDMENL
jgi:hypothetical protein